jgi:hypothetical protein
VRRAPQGDRVRKSIHQEGRVNYCGGAGIIGPGCVCCGGGDAAAAGCAARAGRDAGRRGGTGAGSPAMEAALGAAGAGAAGAFVLTAGGGAAAPAADSEPMILTGGIDDEDGNSYFDETGTPVGPPGTVAGSAREKSATGPSRMAAQLGAYLATSALNGFSCRFARTRFGSCKRPRSSH